MELKCHEYMLACAFFSFVFFFFLFLSLKIESHRLQGKKVKVPTFLVPATQKVCTVFLLDGFVWKIPNRDLS